MHFFQKIIEIVNSPSSSSESYLTLRQHLTLEKIIFLHGQGAFSLIFLLSLISHLILILLFGGISGIFVKDTPPVRARIGVSFAEISSKPVLTKTTSSFFEKPVLKKLDSNNKPKYKKISPKKPSLKKPSLKKSQFLKPSLTKTETPRLKISKPQLQTSSDKIKKKFTSKPKLFNTSDKQVLFKQKSAERKPNFKGIPKFNDKNVPPSSIKSKNSSIKPKNIEIPKFTQEKIPKKNIDTSKFSKTFNQSIKKIPQIKTNDLIETPNIETDMPIISEEPFEGLFNNEQKKDLPLPENVIIPKTKEKKNNSQMPDIKDLQKRKETQLAIEDYNNHISNQIKPNGEFSQGLFVRFLLTIVPSGEITKYEFIEKSGFPPFDLAAELAVRNAELDPLPQALAANPPYVVPIRILPQN